MFAEENFPPNGAAQVETIQFDESAPVLNVSVNPIGVGGGVGVGVGVGVGRRRWLIFSPSYPCSYHDDRDHRRRFLHQSCRVCYDLSSHFRCLRSIAGV